MHHWRCHAVGRPKRRELSFPICQLPERRKNRFLRIAEGLLSFVDLARVPQMNRIAGYVLIVVALSLVLWPAWRGKDSFPLSNFPMFSYGRPDPHMTLSQVLGVRANGSRVPLPPKITCGNVEVLQAKVTITRGI